VNKNLTLGSALALGVGALVAGMLPTSPPVRAQGDPLWLDSYEAAQAASRQSGKPVFLVFR